MNRPKKLKVAPYQYEVRMEPHLSDHAGVLGLCNQDTLTLMLDAGMPDEVEIETLLHEALHALWTQTNLDKKYSDEQEEEVIWSLTPRLLALMWDNPKWMEWMLRRGKYQSSATHTGGSSKPAASSLDHES